MSWGLAISVTPPSQVPSSGDTLTGFNKPFAGLASPSAGSLFGFFSLGVGGGAFGSGHSAAVVSFNMSEGLDQEPDLLAVPLQGYVHRSCRLSNRGETVPWHS